MDLRGTLKYESTDARNTLVYGQILQLQISPIGAFQGTERQTALVTLLFFLLNKIIDELQNVY